MQSIRIYMLEQMTLLTMRTKNENIMLNNKQLKIASIASFTATSDTDNLTKQLHAGLDAGLTINEIKEVFVQLCMYLGFPRAIRGVDIFMDVLAARKASRVYDQQGGEASPITDNRTKYERG